MIRYLLNFVTENFFEGVQTWNCSGVISGELLLVSLISVVVPNFAPCKAIILYTALSLSLLSENFISTIPNILISLFITHYFHTCEYWNETFVIIHLFFFIDPRFTYFPHSQSLEKNIIKDKCNLRKLSIVISSNLNHNVSGMPHWTLKY